MAAGGSVEEIENPEVTRSGKITGVVIAALLLYLAVKNPWTFVFVVGLLISVFLHEVGHFSTARLTGMKVTQFFMGFGPRVWSMRRGEVEYGVRALPLGAFVRIIGMNNIDEVEEAIAHHVELADVLGDFLFIIGVDDESFLREFLHVG